MDENARLDLTRNLAAVYNDAWDDEALMDRLKAEPRTVLAEHGIELPATISVEAHVVEDVPNAPPAATLDDFFTAWDGMVESGRVELAVTGSRPGALTTRELSDEELEGVSGGETCDCVLVCAPFCCCPGNDF